MALDKTHDPGRRSWVASANDPATDFPIQNLPYGVFSTATSDIRIGVAIGDRILDLTSLERDGVLVPASDCPVFTGGALNPFMALPASEWTKTRRAIADLLDASRPKDDQARLSDALVPMVLARLHMPFRVRGFTDFYASREHATNVGRMFRGQDNALMSNWLHMPIGYNGRASTVVVSGTPIRRPLGQLKDRDNDRPRFGPSAKLDFELELGAVVGSPNAMGQAVSVAAAYDMIFGYVLLNDWSARDIQVWEYQPLGPFQSKAFGTSIGAWVVTRDALEPFRAAAPMRETPLLPYLHEDMPNNFDIDLRVAIETPDGAQKTICRVNSRKLYYTSAQQFAHHTSSGCAMETGDLLGSGTISGADPNSFGSLLELTSNGAMPIRIDNGQRTFLQDGDGISITGRCQGDFGMGFGPCTGTILPASDLKLAPEP